MKQNGQPLTKLPRSGRAMLYALTDGKTVRVRTCNDHVLIVVADTPSTQDARLKIEGTDKLLIVMPVVEHTPGKVLAYLVPTKDAVLAMRGEHQRWLETQPNTGGKNTTWALYFGERKPATATNFQDEWSRFLLAGGVVISANGILVQAGAPASGTGAVGTIQDEVEAARRRIAAAAGVSPAAVKIAIEV
jgi:hypothetical protein